MNGVLNHKNIGRLKKRSIVLTATVAFLSLALAVVVVQTTSADFDHARDKAVALLIKPGGNLAQGRALAKNLIRRQPYSPALLSGLALAAEHDGQADEALTLMTAASTLSWREPVTNVWLLDRDLHDNNLDQALQKADALLRLRPDLGNMLYPVLTSLAATPAGAKAIADRLGSDPPWRSAELYNLTNTGTSDAAYSVLSGLQSTRTPPRPDEASGYVQRLVSAQAYDQALLGMFLFLPPNRVGLYQNLFNGEFDDAAGIAPFDWTVASGSGGIVKMEAPAERPKNRALHAYYDGPTAANLVAQTLVLTPGPYRLTGEASSGAPSASNRLQWSVLCASGAELVTTAVKADMAWKAFEASFIVPADCGAEILELRVVAADRHAAVDGWYDSMAIRRTDTP